MKHSDDATAELPTHAFDASGTRVIEDAAQERDAPLDAEPMALEPGEMVEHFRIERSLGAGGMGEVFLAHDTKLDRRVALKVIVLDRSTSDEQRQQFLFEAKATAKFSHPHIVTIHAVGEHSGSPYLVLEYLEGITLQQRIKQGGLALIDVVRIGLAISEALREAHHRGILHLDLKPANVFLPHDRPLRVLDFGLAKSLGARDEATMGAHAGAMFKVTGTPAYMSPERWRNEDSGGAADVWALGVMLFELCAGAPPFVGNGLPALVVAICGPDPSPELPRALDVPEALSRLIRACLDKTSARRPTAASAVEVLTALVVEQDASATSSRRRPEVPTLAVLPLEVRGTALGDDFGGCITDELIDVLSRMRGWRVLASAATARYRGAWEPRAIAEALGAQAIVHGAVQVSRQRVRVTARLVDAVTGEQTWSERFEGDIADILDLEDRLSRRIAEALRSELTTTIHRGDASPEAIGRYLRARQKLRVDDMTGADDAVELLEGCLDLAPSFKPAMSTHAMASLRAWFGLPKAGGRDWEATCRRSVARALHHATDVAETHIAAAKLNVVDGAFAASARAIARALEIAPTCAAAHGFLAMLQCEAGRSDEGLRRARLAYELDPALYTSLIDIMRHHALRGEWARYDAILGELIESAPPGNVGVEGTRLRIAIWRGDTAAIRQILGESPGTPSMAHGLARLPARVFLGELALDDALALFERNAGAAIHPRMRALAGQIITETSFLAGAIETGAKLFLKAADGVLVDLEWVDRCPALEPMRSHPAFADARRKVAERAEAIWKSGCPPLDLVS